MSARFSDQLRQKLDSVWEAQHQHPFVRAIADGTLDLARFEVWLRQDYLFLVEYVRLLSLGAARGPDLETTRCLQTMAHGILHNELLLHQSYAIELGLAQEDLEAGDELPTTRAYAAHLLRTAALGSYVELAAALLPGVWTPTEIAQRLMQQTPPAADRYGRWIDLYSGPVADDLVRQGRRLLDRLARAASPAALTGAEKAFALSSRYEWMFWEMCYRGERWPV